MWLGASDMLQNGVFLWQSPHNEGIQWQLDDRFSGLEGSNPEEHNAVWNMEQRRVADIRGSSNHYMSGSVAVGYICEKIET